MKQSYSSGEWYTAVIFILFISGILLAISRPAVKIWQPTPSRLEFRCRPVIFWGIVAFLSELGLLLSILAWNSTALTTLTCSRSVPNLSFSTIVQQKLIPAKCELIKTNFLGTVKSQIPVPRLQGAKIEKKFNTNPESNVSYYYRIVILTNQGQIPLTINWEFDFDDDFEARYLIYAQQLSRNINKLTEKSQTNILVKTALAASLKTILNRELVDDLNKSLYVNRQTVVSRINTFVKSSQDAALIVQDDLILAGYIAFGLGGFLGLASLLIITAAPTVSCTFSQEIDSLIFKHRKCFVTQVFQESLDHILDVKLESNSENSRHRIILVLTSGKSLPLTDYLGSSLKKKQQVAENIVSFLGIKRAPNTVDSLME